MHIHRDTISFFIEAYIPYGQVYNLMNFSQYFKSRVLRHLWLKFIRAENSLMRENIKSMINSVVDGHSKNEKLVCYGLAVSCTEL